MFLRLLYAIFERLHLARMHSSHHSATLFAQLNNTTTFTRVRNCFPSCTPYFTTKKTIVLLCGCKLELRNAAKPRIARPSDFPSYVRFSMTFDLRPQRYRSLMVLFFFKITRICPVEQGVVKIRCSTTISTQLIVR